MSPGGRAFRFRLVALSLDAHAFRFEAYAFGFGLVAFGFDADGFDFEAYAFGFGLVALRFDEVALRLKSDQLGFGLVALRLPARSPARCLRLLRPPAPPPLCPGLTRTCACCGSGPHHVRLCLLFRGHTFTRARSASVFSCTRAASTFNRSVASRTAQTRSPVSVAIADKEVSARTHCHHAVGPLNCRPGGRT